MNRDEKMLYDGMVVKNSLERIRQASIAAIGMPTDQNVQAAWEVLRKETGRIEDTLLMLEDEHAA